MQLSVIILNYNVRYFLEQCVLSVQKALEGIDGEIIVIDNASSDDSCAMMKQLFPSVRLIENAMNFGFTKGNNIGVAEAKGEYICILNPDTVVAEDAFTKLLNADNWQSNTGIIGCKLIDGSGNFLPESKRGVPTPWVASTKIFGWYKIFPKAVLFNQYYAQHISENQSGEVAVLVGAFMLMRRDLYLNVGGFDENCFMYSDDIDLSYRIQNLGYKNFYFHKTSVIHYKGESTVRDGLYMKRFRESMQFFYNKHFKKSFFFDQMMRVGSFVFSRVKKNQQKNNFREISEYIVFSKNHLDLNFEKPTKYLTDFNEFINQPKKNIEIIFDTTSFSFVEISTFMEWNKCYNLSFKNYISQSNFLIGSDNSNDRGQIIVL